MKKSIKILTFSVLVLTGVFLSLKTIRNYGVIKVASTHKTPHFDITYKGIYRDEAEEIGLILEENYDRIRTELEDPERKAVRVFIHSSQEDFNEETSLLNSRANGTSQGPDEFHLLWTNWFNSFFPDDPRKTAIHEFTHCVQLNILIKDAMVKLDYLDEKSFHPI